MGGSSYERAYKRETNVPCVSYGKHTIRIFPLMYPALWYEIEKEKEKHLIFSGIQYTTDQSHHTHSCIPAV